MKKLILILIAMSLISCTRFIEGDMVVTKVIIESKVTPTSTKYIIDYYVDMERTYYIDKFNMVIQEIQEGELGLDPVLKYKVGDTLTIGMPSCPEI
jgi:hypothetical protein